MRSVLVAAAIVACALGAALPDFTGYIVTAQWDGRTVPNVQWALDITRQDTEFRLKQELKLVNLIPTTPGPALTPTFTAYDEVSRLYFCTVGRNDTSASLWGVTLSGDVSNATWYSNEVRYAYPESEATLVGLHVYTAAGNVTVLAIFENGQIVKINPATGATKTVANIGQGGAIQATTATTTQGDQLYIVMQAAEGAPNRQILTFSMSKLSVVSQVALQSPPHHNPMLEQPFEMVYIDSLDTLLLAFTGNFDQIMYLAPATGETKWAVPSLSEFSGDDGNYEFFEDDRLEDDDTWTDMVYDKVKGKIYFQCTEVTPNDDDTTTTLCFTDVPKGLDQWTFINEAISPMTYGYAGMEYVQVVQ